MTPSGCASCATSSHGPGQRWNHSEPNAPHRPPARRPASRGWSECTVTRPHVTHAKLNVTVTRPHVTHVEAECTVTSGRVTLTAAECTVMSAHVTLTAAECTV